MVHFRKMKLGDMDSIYQDQELRPLITIHPKGRKFAAVIEEEGRILGGASGYAEDNAAFLQCIAIKDAEQNGLYKDGLMRSLIHFLDLDGADYLFVHGEDPLYRKIGFHEVQLDDPMPKQLSGTILEDIRRDNVLCMNLKEFFRNHSC